MMHQSLTPFAGKVPPQGSVTVTLWQLPTGFQYQNPLAAAVGQYGDQWQNGIAGGQCPEPSSLTRQVSGGQKTTIGLEAAHPLFTLLSGSFHAGDHMGRTYTGSWLQSVAETALIKGIITTDRYNHCIGQQGLCRQHAEFVTRNEVKLPGVRINSQ
jgi:hypothetical protein